MANATVLQTLSQMGFYQFSRKGTPTPKLAAPLNSYTDTDVVLTAPLKDENDAVVTIPYFLGIKKANGWTETCLMTPDAGGLTGTLVRGLNPGGLDWTTGSAAFADDHDQDEAVFCSIPAQVMALLVSAIQGTIASGGSGFTIGTNAAGTITIYRSTGVGAKTGVFRWNTGNGKAEYANDGITWNSIDSATASNLVVVTNSDTTPSNLNGKTSSGTGITRTVTNPGGNEVLQFSVNGTLSALISDVTATAAEINGALHGKSANVTAANLSTLTGGGNADALHVHSSTVGNSRLVTYGDTITAGQLLYEDMTTGKWSRVTSSGSTWYGNLGIAQASGVNNDTNKLVLTEGLVTGLSFANINPSFISALTGTDIAVGDAAADTIATFLIDNTSGAEAVLVGTGTISAKQQGTPSGQMNLYLVLPQQEQANSPAAVWDPTANVVRGAIIGTASIAQANFSGIYQNQAFDFGAGVKIPAGCKAYLCVSKAGVVNASNYYLVQSNAVTRMFTSATDTWSGTISAGNITLNVTSTSPIGYGVKAYQGAVGTFGLTPTNPWSRVIGTVISATSMYFDPKMTRKSQDALDYQLAVNAAGGYGFVTTNFCPSSVYVDVSSANVAAANQNFNRKGFIRGDKTGSTAFTVDGFGSGGTPDSFIQPSANTTINASSGAGSRTTIALNAGQNQVYAVRFENGVAVYNGYPSGTGYISAGAGTFVSVQATFWVVSQI